MSIIGPQTPQRPLPGAFMKTPNPTGLAALQPVSGLSNGLSAFSGPKATNEQALVPQGSLPVANKTPDLRPIERGAKTVNEVLQREQLYPELDNYVSQGTSCEYDVSEESTWAPFQRLRLYDIPEKIFDQYNRARLSTSMGLFADLNHAWVAIDNALYLWDYTQTDPPLIGFEEQQKQITAVELVTPRPGVFVASINRLLVVATTAEIYLIGLSANASPTGGHTIALFSTGLHVPIKSFDVSSIVGSARTGRIFFAGRDNDDICEITYQQEEKWFSSRCGKINQTGGGLSAFAPPPLLSFGSKQVQEHVVQLVIDDSRSLLYALSSRSTVRVFHMTGSNSLSCVITRTMTSMLLDITHMSNAMSSLLSSDMSIVSISPISAHEASKMHIMATTSTGCRIYLSATSSYSFYAAASSSGTAPNSMQVQHVKFPPADVVKAPDSSVHVQPSDNSRILVPTRSAERFAPGYFFCFVPRTSCDAAFVSAPDTGRIIDAVSRTSRFIELGMWLGLQARVEAIGLVSAPFQATPTPQGFANELATQYDQAASQIAILTNTGVHVLRRRRLVDVFAAMIRNGGGNEGLEAEMKKFVRRYGRSEFASTALATACGQSLDVTSDARLVNITDPDILEFAKKAFIEYGGKPHLQENAEQTLPLVDLVQTSSRHDGLSIYLARIVRIVWKAHVVREVMSPTTGRAVLPQIPIPRLNQISQDLIKVKEFLKLNKSFIDGLSGPDALSLTTSKQDEIALQAEHRALHSLMCLIDSMIEGIAFVQVLFDERIDEVLMLLSPEVRQSTCQLTFEQLFSTDLGKDLAKELVKAIVNRNIANGSNVETVADALRRRCGTFCSADDVVVFKAQEQLKRASAAGADSELSRSLLNESLRLYMQVTGTMSFEQLQWAVNNFGHLQFFAGAIRLALSMAQQLDGGNKALSWIEDGRPAEDPRLGIFEARKRCYQLIHTVIDTVDGQAPSGTVQRRREAAEVIDQSTDEVFHTDLYDWYLSQDKTEKILDIRSPFIVSYLQRKSGSDMTAADLLWRYHSRNSRHHEAAAVQLELARSDFALPLDDRIQYLGRAKANASMASPGVSRQDRYQLAREVGDLLDIANIQSDLLNRLTNDHRVALERRPVIREELDGPLLPMNVLYNRYAEEAAYFDICILIYQIADYRNPNDILRTWRNLIDRTHEETVQRSDNGPLPWEAIAEKVRSLGARLSLTEAMFPVSDILPLLKRYAFELQRGVGPANWVVDVFLDIGVAVDSIFTVLEGMVYNDEAPFQGRNRRFIADDIIYVVGIWLQKSHRAKEGLFGSAATATGVTQCLAMLQQSGSLDPLKAEECRELRVRLEHTLGW